MLWLVPQLLPRRRQARPQPQLPQRTGGDWPTVVGAWESPFAGRLMGVAAGSPASPDPLRQCWVVENTHYRSPTIRELASMATTRSRPSRGTSFPPSSRRDARIDHAVRLRIGATANRGLDDSSHRLVQSPAALHRKARKACDGSFSPHGPDKYPPREDAMPYRPHHTALLSLSLALAIPLSGVCAQGTSDPIPEPLASARDPIRVNIGEFATLPDVGGIAPRMMILEDEPVTGQLFVSEMQGADLHRELRRRLGDALPGHRRPTLERTGVFAGPRARLLELRATPAVRPTGEARLRESLHVE